MNNYGHIRTIGLQITDREATAIIGLLTTLAGRNDSNSSDAWRLRSRMIVETGRAYPEWERILAALPLPDSPNDENGTTEEDSIDGW